MIQVKDQVYYLGLRDWEIKEFHGHELSTHHGTSYNSYLIKDEKTVLVDTIWDTHANTFLDILDREVNIDQIDFIVVNHAEPDHGGSLGRLLERRPDLPIYCSVKGAEIIRRHFHKDWNFRTVKSGDTLNIGKCELQFVDMTMIHWPDSMMTFVKGPNVLLSNDAFGQHYCPASIFEDEADPCTVWQEAEKYFGYILTPFAPLIRKKLAEVVAMKLPIEVIAPSHGVIWRKDPLRIVEKYALWANDYHEGTAVVAYDTMYNATKKMAEAIAEGIESRGVKCKLFNCAVSDASDVVTEMFKAKGIVLGSCTVNNSYLRSIAGILEEIHGHKFKNKIGASFGSYGWSGEAHKKIHKQLEEAGIKVVMEPKSVKYQPDSAELDACVQMGQEFADILKRS